jgi:hypothetical protein
VAKFTRNAQAQRGRAAGLMIAMAFGLVGKGSQTFLSLKAVRSYDRRALYAHPTWVAQIVRHHVGVGQVVVEEVR